MLRQESVDISWVVYVEGFKFTLRHPRKIMTFWIVLYK